MTNRDSLGGPVAVWVDTDSGDAVIKDLKADPDDPRVVPFPGTDAVELPDRMKPIILEAIGFVRALGLELD